jgi:glutamate-1-semialdehyde aminotransferase
MKEKCRVFLGNSGTEAVEGAIKLARFTTKRQYLVAFLGAFHGRTYGSVSLTASKAKYHAGFGPMLPGVFHAPFGHVADLKWFDEVLFKHLVPAGAKWRRSSSSRSRARAATSSPRTASCRACAASATSTASC